MVVQEQKQLTVVGKPSYNDYEQGVKVTSYPPQPVPKQKNFGWLGEEDESILDELYYVFIENKRVLRLVYDS